MATHNMKDNTKLVSASFASNSNSAFAFNTGRSVLSANQSTLVKIDFNIARADTRLDGKKILRYVNNGVIFYTASSEEESYFMTFRATSSKSGSVRASCQGQEIDLQQVIYRAIGLDPECGLDIKIKCDLNEDTRDAIEEGARSMSIYLDFNSLGFDDNLKEFAGSEYLELNANCVKQEYSLGTIARNIIPIENLLQAMVEVTQTQAPSAITKLQAMTAKYSKRQAKKAVKRAESLEARQQTAEETPVTVEVAKATAPEPVLENAPKDLPTSRIEVKNTAFGAGFNAGALFDSLPEISESAVSTVQPDDFVDMDEDEFDWNDLPADTTTAVNEAPVPVEALEEVQEVVQETKVSTPVPSGTGFAPKQERQEESSSEVEAQIKAAKAKAKGNQARLNELNEKVAFGGELTSAEAAEYKELTNVVSPLDFSNNTAEENNQVMLDM